MRTRSYMRMGILLTLLVISLSLLALIFMVRSVSPQKQAGNILSLQNNSNSTIRHAIYAGSLAPRWVNWSWASRVDLANTSTLYLGSKSISFTPTESWGVLYLHTNTALLITPHSFLHFVARAGATEQNCSVRFYDENRHLISNMFLATHGGDPVADVWKAFEIQIPLSHRVANTAQMGGFAIHCNALSTLYVAAISLTIGVSFAPTASSTSPSAPAGNTYYVSPSGNDHNSGSQAHPFATIQQAAYLVAPGTTVHVLPGTYNLAGTIDNERSGTASERITFISDVKWGAKIITSGVHISFFNGGNYVDIIGFDITGDGAVGIDNAGSSTRFVGNHVHDIPAMPCSSSGGAGIDDANYTAHDDDIIGNVVDHIGTGACASVQGIYHSNLRGHISNNISYKNSGWGIHLWHAANATVVSNNLVFENRTGGIVIGAGDDPGGVIDDGTIVSNNIVVYNYVHAGITEYGETGAHNQYLNNLVYANPGGAFRLLNGNKDIRTLAIDPQFVNWQPDGSGDYNLRATSPAIGAGTSIGAPSNDIDGTPRPIGNRWDIGPYELKLLEQSTITRW